MASLREQVMAAVATRLETITTANSYSRTVRQVKRTRAEIPEYPTTPSIYVYEGTETKDEGDAIGKLACSLDVVVVYIDEDYTNQATTANDMLADVSKAMGTQISLTDTNSLNSTAILVERGNEVVIDPNDTKLIYAVVDFEARYMHEPGDQDKA